ncbi:non-ribosomal peptide synthetase/type I polyketide synthase [Chitinophaga solisilvae]|uniref:non-ribosomal peptide synthetase/type I polyketide synthase n=1 Tax=Chitinophaga solisilvae TaxID=1233460 RepID=UPI00136DB31A|nr:non-ribosomal peptide synthetase/type I polyketide synthase [Chitinophaga solisilvae]
MKRSTFPQTLTAMLTAQKDNRQHGVTFISGAAKEEFLSYRQLYTDALAILAYLQHNGVQPGNEVILQVDDNKTFVQFFWGCIMGGFIPVPVAVTYQGENAQKLFRIWQLLDHPYLLTSKTVAAKLKTTGTAFEERTLFTEDALQDAETLQGKVFEAAADDIAFLQFSSGSTGNPKGVVLQHSNVLANIIAGLATHDTVSEDRRLSWMPLTHDLGLIFFHLYPVAAGASHFLMPTDLFIRNPMLWMQKISAHRATITGSPNFGYKYYLNQFSDEKAADLDLSSLQVIINGAEPISGTLCRRFMETLAPYHLPPTAMRPAYGLAESTLLVTFSPPDKPVESLFVHRDALTTGRYVTAPGMLSGEQGTAFMELVNTGVVVNGSKVRITDEKGKQLKEGGVGVIRVKGGSVTRRYYNNEAASKAVISEDGWLNTGDTGFLLHGSLYIAGRVKDIIIVNGMNVYPHDIEQTIETLDEVDTGKVVACGVPDEEESSEAIVVFVLFKLSADKFAPLARTIKRLIAAQLGLEVKHVLPVRKIEKTTSGKVKRYLFSEQYRNGAFNEAISALAAAEAAILRDAEPVSSAQPQLPVRTQTEVRRWLEHWLLEHLQLTPAELGGDKTFTSYGLTSMQAVQLANALETFLGVTVDNTIIYNYPTVNSLVAHVGGAAPAQQVPIQRVTGNVSEKIAIVGMGCRFPGNVNSPEAFWKLLLSGRNTVTTVPADRWEVNGWYDGATGTKGKMYTKEGSFIQDADKFDPLFFGISPREAIAMDPQQRLLLEVCQEALEHAGIRPADLRGSNSGVFIGMGADDYRELIAARQDASYFEDVFTGLGTERSVAAGRIAYLFDFHGPVVQLDTACSSSLVTIHQACQSLLYDNCSLALAGGVNLLLSPEATVKLCQMQALSPTGSCKTFDDNADGYVRGEGAGIVVLKRLSDALADGDRVLAVISAAVINHDGLSNGISAPNGVAQQQLIHKALHQAGISAAEVQYIETHGTGTRLGDPVEVQALNAVYGRSRSKEQPLLLGAVKSNIGHLEAAAGIAGLMKTVLCLQHRQIPANIHFQTPNRFIPWDDMPVQVVNRLTPWQPASGIRRGAVSAFGLSGTNAHVILEEAPAVQAVRKAEPPALPLLLSARSQPALNELALRTAGLLKTPGVNLGDIAYTSATGRDHYQYRIAVEVNNPEEAATWLEDYAAGKVRKNILSGDAAVAPAAPAWLFTGQGSQYYGMGRELYAHNGVFRRVIDHCDAWLKTKWDISLVTLLYDMDAAAANVLLRETRYTQPALFAIGCALAEVWKSWGLQPAMVAGHSVGEYAAAYVAGVFSLDDGLQLITARAAYMHAVTEPGGMAMVFAPEQEVRTAIASYGDALSVAAVNGPALTVISGRKAALAEVLTTLKQQGAGSRELAVSHAFHSPLMQSAAAAFEKVAAGIQLHMPAVPLVSNVTGDIAGSEIASAAYWRRHILAPVLFSKSIITIKDAGVNSLLELGAQSSLLAMAQLTLSYDDGALLPSMREGQSSWSTMIQALAALHVKGLPVNWPSFYNADSYTKVMLPSYPFQRRRYWIEEKQQPAGVQQILQVVQPPIVAETVKPVVTATVTRAAVTANIVALLSRLLKTSPEEINIHTPFLSQGADSLILASVVRKIESEYGLQFTMRLLFEKLTTVALMADYIAEHTTVAVSEAAVTAPVEKETPVVAAEACAVQAVQQYTPEPAPVAATQQVMASPAALSVQQTQLNLITQQFQLLTQQLQLVSDQLQAGAVIHTAPVAASAPPPAAKPPRAATAGKRPSIFPKVDTSRSSQPLTPQQQAYLDAFIARYTSRTKTSKAVTRQYRPVMADIRASAGFRFLTKELVYPIVAASSRDGRITDVDGNEYIDLTMGFGVNLLGHRPEVVMQAVSAQLEKGCQLGPQTQLAGEVATKITALTGMDRVSFHNSGTEAVMAAMRIARTLSGKPKIAIFQGSYHGYFDGTLALAEDIDTDHSGVPVAPGILPNMVADVLVFDYHHPDVVEQIRAHAHELAAVLVEPVQSRRPDYQPKALLQALRAMTTEEQIILIFDEMITGFRIHPGGVQAHFGIAADMVTYGKIIGGGFPIGVVAGREWCMRAVDGGQWEYGDDSYPQAETTFLAGTFCKHPVSMAAALAVLTELEHRGPSLQQQLSARADKFVQTVSALFKTHQVPVQVQHFGSLIYFTVTGNMDLFFYHLIEKGVYIWEGRSCFIATAHTAEDLKFVEEAFAATIADLQSGGFLPGGESSPSGRKPATATETGKESALTIGHEPMPAHIPLSYSQERLWFIDQLEGSVQYAVPLILRLKGPLNREALAASLHAIVERHEVLRTVIDQEDGQPFQRVLSALLWDMEVVSDTALQHDPAALYDYIAAQVYAPFDLAKDSMLRAQLICLSEEEHVLALTAHHIVFDDWSARVLIEELTICYHAFAGNRLPALPPLAIQYKDYAVWQRNYLQGSLLEEKLAYWKKQLEHFTPLLLPTDFERPVVRSTRGAVAEVILDKGITEKVMQLARRHGVTLFATLLSAFKVLLSRYSGLEDISVAAALSGRTRPETEPLLGFFANTLVLRTDLSGQPTFETLLKRVTGTVLDAHEYQEVPLNKIMEAVVPERSTGDNPLLHVIFTLQQVPELLDMKLGEAKVTVEPVARPTSMADMTWKMEERADGLSIEAEYATDLFTAATIQRMLQHYAALLQQVTTNAAVQISALSLLHAAEQEEQLVSFNDTRYAYPADKSMVTLFAEQATATPDAAAVSFGEEKLTYRSLHEKSAQVAQYLIAAGVQPGEHVGLLSLRGPDMIIALWGILKSGAAYVPFHTGFPADRIEIMMEDAGISRILFTDKQLFDSIGLPEGAGVSLDGAWQYPATDPGIVISADACANVMYTSGTTGRPKGIAVSHRNIVNMVYEPGTITIQQDDKVLQWSNYAFDGSTWDIFSSLLRGAQLCMIPESAASDALELAEIMHTQQVSVCLMTTSLFNTFVDSDVHALRGLRKILFGGEKASPAHVERAFAVVGAGKLVNLYGPTETTVYATSYAIDAVKPGDTTVPIGRPVANTRTLILDRYGNIVPMGIDGELYIGGDGVAIGYLNNKALNEEKFVHLKAAAGRWYRTGDLCHRQPDGNIVYTGRVDDQVKIRGYRIEPAEIERVMNQLEDITASTVMVKQRATGDKLLVGYYTPATAVIRSYEREGLYEEELLQQISESLEKPLRQILQAKLPDYMVPSVLIALRHMPLTGNGKTDRQQLGRRDDINGRQTGYVAPVTHTEQQLAAIWQRLLGMPQIGTRHSFFALGGHSLLATRVVSAVRKELGVELSVRDLFNHVTIEALAAWLEQQQHTSLLPPVTAGERPAHMPLSYSQERLWFIDQLEGSVQYHMSAAFQLRGALNPAALEYALRNAVNRHEVLRTVIVQEDGAAYQQVLDKDQWQLQHVDGAAFHDSDTALRTCIHDLTHIPFDLSKDHMLRAYLITQASEENILLLSIHHIAADGWSLSVLMNELAELYSAFTANRTPVLEAVPVQYADFAIWQRKHIAGEVLESKIAYWKQQLKALPVLKLPTDFERPSVSSTNGAMQVFYIEEGLTRRLQQLSREQDSTLYMTLLAVFKVLLYKYTGEEDIAVGSGIAGRQQSEIESLIGFFVNTLVIRNNIGQNPVFTDFLQQVRKNTLDAYEHQDVPFEKVVEAVAGERDRNRNPLFQVMFAVQNMSAIPELKLDSIALTQYQLERTTSMFDIFLSVSEKNDLIEIEAEYCTDIFTEATIRKMMQHYLTLLEAVVQQPMATVNSLDMISREETVQLLAFNNAAIAYPADKPVVALFEAQVAATPEATAVSFGEEKLTYRSLHEKSDQVAQYLIAAGVQPGEHVGLLSLRGPDMIIALWGILKSGAAYVPIHTGFPADRVQLMMEDAGMTRILYTDKKVYDNIGLPEAAGLPLHDAWHYPATGTGISMSPEAIVNIMYTSGTTGRPKGIAVNHRNIVKLVYEPGAIAVQPADKVLQWSNYAFDGSTWDIFSSLLRGAQLCLIPESAASDALELAGIIHAQQVTTCFMTTALFNTFVDSDIDALRCLRKVLFGGEKVSLTHVEKALAVLGAGKLVHVYGPTETTVYATSYEVDSIKPGDTTVPIGRPLANTRALILDRYGNIVPVGVDGELYIGGDGVTAGYLHNETLNEEKFVALKTAAGRWYRTGDLCRWQQDGNIIYTGRTDDQVKIRGYRLEPAEIERTMNQLEQITAGAVIVKQRASGEKLLVAYYIPDAAVIRSYEREGLHEDELLQLVTESLEQPLRLALQAKLPDYMVPSVLIALRQLPLTSNGKTDRKQLGRRDDINGRQTGYVAPVTHTEQQLAAIWQRLLGITQVGTQHSFFELGGHSLLATRVVSAVRKELGMELSVRDLFNHVTIARLAAWLEQQQQTLLLPLVTAGERPAHTPLSYSQERLWFIDQLEGSVQYHMSAAFHLRGILNPAALEYALRNVVNRHEVLRTVMIQEGGTAYQQVLDKDQWQLRYVDGTAFHGNDAALRTCIHDLTHIPFDLSTDHMLRAYLITQASEENILVLYLHHIASDGWSLSVLMNELAELYSAFTANRAPVLETLPVQYADFALWQRKHIAGEVLERKTAYWKQQLEGLPALKLPTDFERPSVNSTNGAMQVFHIEEGLTQRLQQLSREHDSTLYMTLLAVFKVLLYKYTGQEDIAVGSGIAGRLQSEIESLIGFFVNTLVIRNNIGQNPVFTDFLQQVRKNTLDAYEHQEVPFEKVVETMVGERDTSRNPLFQVMFAVQNMPDIPQLKLGGVTLTQYQLEHTTSMFDIFLSVSEKNNRIEIEAEYCTDIFTEATIRKMMRHYVALLEAVVQQPVATVNSLGMISREETAQLLAFNDTAIAYPADKTITALFTSQAVLTPDAAALKFDATILTYAQLDTASTQLAHYLLLQGVTAGSLVPLCIGRSPELMISILAILKAGAAYVPVDPSYPADRIAFMLQDTAGALVITTTEHTALLHTALPGVPLLQADMPEVWSGQPLTQLTGAAGADAVAYVIYTSGSTGKPKGVMVSHRNVVSLVKGGDFVSLSSADVILSTGSPSFDATTFEYWGALLNGGTLVLCEEKRLLDNMLLKQEIRRHQVTKMWFTASWFNQLVDDDIDIFEGLTAVLAGGEKLSDNHVARFLAAHPGITMINGYGPTENTTFSLTHTIAAVETGKSIPVGRPLRNRQAYVLDQQLQLTPAGVPGELYTGGAGVSLGYLNQPALTAERFIDNPFLPGTKLYRTGDKARWLDDGTVAYLGRTDDQVKIRGYRIEPGEIERTINELNGVTTSCVVVKEPVSGDKRLAGYYIPDPAQVLLQEQQLYRLHVENWKELYEMAFTKPADYTPEDPEFDITGWNDSFTGGAIPADQMRSWLQDISSLILSLKPQHVLEIGCGTGLIYYQLAAHISRYIGTDFSPVSTGQLQAHISRQLRSYPDTTLQVCAAHEISIDDAESIDLVVLNSVVQYFPGAQYMTEVIAKAIRMLKGNGHIVIGDVRDLRLLPAFKRRLQLDKMQDRTVMKDFAWFSDQEVLKEEELCFSPAYFYRLQTLFPEITHVEIQWKQADYSNELSLYRYTVVLYVGIAKETAAVQWLPYQEATEQLRLQTPVIALKDMPNPRLWKEQQLAQALHDKSVIHVRDLQDRITAPDSSYTALQALLESAVAAGYSARYLLHDDPLKMNVLLERIPVNGFVKLPAVWNTTGTTHTNIPLFPDICAAIEKDMYAQLEDRLPDYMIPSEFTALQYFPLTNNGKTDRKFLADWEDVRQQDRTNYHAPTTPQEIIVAEIWQRLLGVERIGTEDNFFELGGHSLLATRVVSAIRKKLEVELTVRDFFVYPTISTLVAYLQGLQEGVVLPAVTAAVRPARIPLSFGQERLWFIDRLQGSVHYHMQVTLRLRGELDKAALEAALQMIIHRHEALRTVIRVNEATGEGYQHILDIGAWHLQYVHNQAFSHNEKVLRTTINTLMAQPFDLSADYMLRAHLVPVHATEHILLATIHHISSDGWSLANFIRELVTLYHDYTTHQPLRLMPLPLQYADYAIWQRTYLSGEVQRRQLAYWKTQLQGAPQLLLPADYERPVVQSTNGAATVFNVDAALAAQLQQFSRQQGVTLFMTLLAAFKVLLYRYSGQEDISVGSGVAGRTQEETEDMIGFFVNTLVMRSQLHQDQTFTDFLQQVKTTTLNAYANQDAPFESVVEAVADKRDISMNPLFQVVFLLQNAPKTPMLKLGDITLEETSFGHTTSLFDMSFFVTEHEDGLRLDVEYCTDLFKETTIQRLLNCYYHLLQAVVQTPQEKITGLRMMDEASQQQLLTDFGAIHRDYSAYADKTVIDQFTAQVAAYPQATALIYGEVQLTYQQLDEQSGRLADYLAAAGITAEMLVPVCLERSPEMIIAILGILKAGGAYVPVDMEYPAERMAYIFDDTAAKLIISSADSLKLLPLQEMHKVVDIHEALKAGAAPRKHVLSAQQLAYLIYTSGSTGTPKGVMIAHESVVNLTLAMKEALRLEPGMKTLQFASIGFDAACYEIFNTLLSGGCLVLADKEQLLSGATLEALINRHGISVAVLPPSYLQAMKDTLGSLTTIVSAGEALNSSLAAHIQSRGIRLINAYGPTESTVCASLTDTPLLPDNSVSIGRPVANVPLYVLGPGNSLCPVGAVGELCIGGIQVARGYLNRITLTDERFIKDPFSANGRLYKTGDLVRWLPDGNLIYLGRRDEQVKIRGHRIELGEIENVISNLQLVNGSCVVMKKQEYNNRLICYYVPDEAGADMRQQLRTALQQQLPDYMVPADFIALAELPLTSSGKADRKLLSARVEEVSLKDITFQAPSTVTERHLAAIWQELLGVSQVSVNDNFFELGGDSIIIIQVVNRAKHYGYILQPRELFMHQTIAELAALLQHSQAQQINGEQGYLSGSSGLLPVQQWYLEDESNVSDHFIQSVPFELHKAISQEMLTTAIEHIVSFHDSLRFAYSQENGQWRQWYGDDKGTVVVVDLRNTPADDLHAAITAWENKYRHSLDMRAGKLLCAVLFLTPASVRANRLLIVIHHLGVDVVSWRILLEDLGHIFQHLQDGKSIPLTAKSSSYREWYNALNRYAKSDRLLAQRPYWLNMAAQYLPLKTDKSYDGLVRISEMTAHRVILDAGYTRQLLLEVSPAYRTDVKDLLLTAFALTMTEWTGNTAVAVGFEKHGREDIDATIDTSHTTGWFTTLSPVLLETAATREPGALLQQIREQMKAVPDKGLGFGVLKYMTKEPGLQGKDPWDVIFNYHGQIDNVSNQKWISLTDTQGELRMIGEYTMRFRIFVDSVVTDNELVIDWLYSTLHYDAATMKTLGAAYIRYLQSLISHCMTRVREEQLSAV